MKPTKLFCVLMVLIVFAGCSEEHHELACREGKLFEVSNEGNITIYDYIYAECEVTNGIR